MQDLAREGIDERQFRVGLRFPFLMRNRAILWLGAVTFCAHAQEPAILAQIAQAEREAQRQPGDPAAVGVLAMTLHAYQQYDGAERACFRARGSAPNRFDWLYL